MNDITALYRELSQAFGPSGREDAIREVIASYAGEFVDDIATDTLGNLICHKKGNGKKILFAAHMDTVGVVATHMDKKGFIRFAPIGGLLPEEIVYKQVQFSNGACGVISYEEKTPLKDIAFSQMFIDIGADAARKVQPGDFAVFRAPYFEQDGILCGAYIDNRIGCAILLRVMEELTTVENDLYFIFTVQEEVGLRGAGATAFEIAPDIAVVVDVTDAGDLPEQKNHISIKMGKGSAIKIMDKSVICSPAVCRKLEDAAVSCGIDIQREIAPDSGTDTSVIQKARSGILAGAVSIPTRYIHTSAEMCALSDVEDAVKILTAFSKLAFQ